MSRKTIKIGDRSQTTKEWADEIGITINAFHTRLSRFKGNPEMWLKKPNYQNTNIDRMKYFVNNGIKKSFDGWLKHYNVVVPEKTYLRSSLKKRISLRVERLNWDFKRAFTEEILTNEP